MTTQADRATEPDPRLPTRRQRQRQATYAEIVAAARTLLRGPAPLSLRAVAHEMGMTAPALYRYVDGYDELVALVSDAIFDDVVAHLLAARDSVDVEDPAGQLVVSAVAFRTWALAHREEFGLVFASRDNADAEHAHEPKAGGFSFSEFFCDLYLRVQARYGLSVPSDLDLPPQFLAAVQALPPACGAVAPPATSTMTPGLVWVFTRAWSRLYGMVTLEVFGHLEPDLVRSGEMFAAMIEDNARDLGLEAEWSRLSVMVGERMGAPSHDTGSLR